MLGISSGIAFQIKQVTLFDFIAVLIIVFLKFYADNANGINLKKNWIILCKKESILILGFLIAWFLIILYFWILGHLDDYLFANFSSNINRISQSGRYIFSILYRIRTAVINNLLLYLFFAGAVLDTLFIKKLFTERAKKIINYSILWFLFAAIGVYIGKQFYFHYFLALLPPLCLVSAGVITNLFKLKKLTKKIKIFALFSLLTLAFYSVFDIVYLPFKKPLIDAYNRYLLGKDNWGDNYAIISKYIRSKIIPDEDYIYIVDSQPIVYYLSKSKIPTKYAFPSFLIGDLNQITGIDPLNELENIFLKQPTYIIALKNPEITLKMNFFIKN